MTGAGGPEVMQVGDAPEPVAGPGMVRIRVRAAGVVFAEVMARLGLYQDAPRLPAVLGYEVAGTVEAVGEGVSSPGPGTRVLAMTAFGGQAEVVAVPADQAVPMPEGMSFEEGAALPVNYLTAYHMLFEVGHLRRGQSVLVHMAAGGVGIAALQLARTVPEVTVLGTASASKLEVVRAEGCTHPIDYRARDYAPEVLRLTGGKGVNLVLDALGGADWKKGYQLLRPTGQLVMYGWSNMAAGPRRNLLHVAAQLLRMPRFSPIALMGDNRGVAGVNVGHLWGEAEMMKGELEALLVLYRQGAIRPRVDSVFPFDRAADAHRRIQERKNVGKVLLVP
jgi:NADPH:quinone reductase-like Zn-dependent oxidoreductase